MKLGVVIAGGAIATVTGACRIEDHPFSPTIDAGSETGRVVMSPETGAITEGQNSTLLVHVEDAPTGGIQLECTSELSTHLRVEPTTVVFTHENAAMDQALTLMALHDTDAVSNQVRVTCAGLLVESGVATFNINDDDTLAIETTPGPFTVTEGAQTVVQVRMTAAPAGSDLSVNALSENPSKLSVQPATLFFGPGNWDTFQSVTVSGTQDADAVDDTATVSLSATGVTTVTLPFTVDDDD